MFKAFLAVLTCAFSLSAFAAPSATDVLLHMQMASIADQAHTQALDWKVGDTASYNVDMSILKGTMVMSVTSIGADGIWMEQDLDLSMAGKQQVQSLIDPNTGAVKKMIVNGKEQEVPKQNLEVIDTTEDKITVPAGTFDCIHARLKDKDQNDQEVNIWLNPGAVPLSGAIKETQPSQFGIVTIELTSFKKN